MGKRKGQNKYLIALPSFRGSKGFNHPTVLISAKDEPDAIDAARHIKGYRINIGSIKKVDY